MFLVVPSAHDGLVAEQTIASYNLYIAEFEHRRSWGAAWRNRVWCDDIKWVTFWVGCVA